MKVSVHGARLASGWSLAALLALGCGDGDDRTRLAFPDLSSPSSEPFLGFPSSADAAGEAPRWLSETGAFSDAAALEPAPGLVPYDVASPLWSDGALKRRWLSLPVGETITFVEDGAFEFPPGTVLVKHFGMALDERAPERVERLETRFLVATREGRLEGYVYRWNDDQTDAALLEEGLDEELEVTEADGRSRRQIYSYPGPSECQACHSERVGFAMGPRTKQLNVPHQYDTETGSVTLNQLSAWNAAGFFDPPLDDRAPADYPSLSSLDDESRSLEDRVRSYWDSNCSSCHDGRGGRLTWDARYEVGLADQNVIDVVPFGGARDDGVRLIKPGDPWRSLLYLRVQSTVREARMPPVASNRVDEQYVRLLTRWIATLDPNP